MHTMLEKIESKVKNGIRLTREDGIALFASNDLTWLGYLADIVRQRVSGEYVYYNGQVIGHHGRPHIIASGPSVLVKQEGKRIKNGKR